MGRHLRTPAAPALTAVVAALALAAGCSSSDGGEDTGSRDAAAKTPASAPATSGGGTTADEKTPAGTAEQRAQEGTARTGPAEDGTAEKRSPTRTPWCDTDRLTVTLRALSPGAGQRYAVLTLTNASDTPCRTKGYIGLQLLTDARTKLSTDVVRDRSRTPRALTLTPGASAWSRLHWGAVPGEGDSETGQCQPSPARLQVTPPDSYSQEETAWTHGLVCQSGRIDVTALSQDTPPS